MKQEIDRCIEVLNGGGTILYPTDTIWGIGCLATDESAVDRVYNIKKRPDTKSMLILLDNANRLSSYLEEVPEVAWDLIEAADSPLTIIYPGAKNLAKNLVSDDHSIGIRIVQDQFCSQLVQRLRRPIVSTSANISGSPPPVSFNEIDMEIINAVDYVVNLRQDETESSKASSIIKLGLGGEISIIRK